MALAKKMLGQAVSHFHEPEKKPNKFAKTLAYSDIKETRVNLQEKQGSILQRLREKPDPSLRFPQTVG